MGRIVSESEGQEYFSKITIADNGIGFEKEKASNIFDIFYAGWIAAVNSRERGIGLAICKRVLQNHRGFILASGTARVKGAAFSFFLPTPR